MRRAIDDPAAVASFHHLHGEPEAGRACRGLACFAARQLQPGAFHQACQDSAPIYCLGQCHAAPAIAGAESRPNVRVAALQPVLLENVVTGPVRSLSEYLNRGGGQSLDRARLATPDGLIQLIIDSNLRGRGGAGFSAGKKWRAVRAAAASSPPPIIVVNADEGDPGAFSDKVLLEDDPFRLLEGIAIAAAAIGADEAVIYLRCEYPTAARVWRDVLAQVAATDWLGGLKVRLHSGHGSFVCGEETSLLNSLEGRRPFARTRPPYPVQHGYHGCPTLVHNVETLCATVWIVAHGAKAYRELGCGESAGTKLISLSSLFRNPGLVEVPFGIPVRQIVQEIGGGARDCDFWGVMIGGPLAGVLPPHVWSTPFTYEDLARVHGAVGHGGVVAFDQATDLGSLMLEVFRFGATESCGLCVPCRQGLSELSEAFDSIADRTPTIDRQRWFDLVAVLEHTSICGHGRGMAEFARSLQLHFPQELATWLR